MNLSPSVNNKEQKKAGRTRAEEKARILIKERNKIFSVIFQSKAGIPTTRL